MMHVLVFGGFADSLIKFRGPMLLAMVQRGHRVTAVAPSASPMVRASLSSMGVDYRDVPLSRTGLNPLPDLRTLLHLIRLFRELKPDAVLSYTIKPVIYGSLAAYIARVPAIYSMITGLGYAFAGTGTERKWIARLAAFLYGLAVRRNRRVFFQNPDDRAFFLDAGMLRCADCAVLINGSGVDLHQFGHVSPPTGVPSFLLVARLIKDKGILEYVEAARVVKRSHPEAQFRLLGPLDINPTALSAAQIAAWESEGLISYLGETWDVRPALADCSVFVLPSYSEGTPRSTLEALALGRAVITTDAPGCRETVVDGENGFLVPVRNAPALAQAMSKFVEHPELVERMGNAGRRLAEEKFDVNKVNAAILGAMEL